MNSIFDIEIVKVDGIFKMTDDELHYVFALAKTLGGRAISTEISNKDEELKRLGQFADQHRFMVGYHGHATTTPAHWETAFSFAKHNGANVDLGHSSPAIMFPRSRSSSNITTALRTCI